MPWWWRVECDTAHGTVYFFGDAPPEITACPLCGNTEIRIVQETETEGGES